MSINLLELVTGAMSGQVGRLASILGETEQNTKSVVNVAVPAIIGGLMKKASTGDGANEIFKTLDDHDGNLLDNLGGLLGGGNHTGLLEKGTGILGMLFGSTQSSLFGTIAKLVGISDGKVGTILRLLAPIVMGVLGKQRRSHGLDVGGLTKLLMSQKDHLAGQIPSDLSDLLRLGNLIGDVGAAEDVGAAAVQGVQSVGRSVGETGPAAASALGDAGKSGGNLLMTMLPLIILAGLAFFAFQSFDKKPIETPGISGMTIPKIDLPGFDAAGIFQTFGGLIDSVGGVKDEETARLVLPRLEQANTMIGALDLGAIAAGPQKKAVGDMFGGLIAKLKAALDTAYAIPGIREILEPVVQPFLDKFAVFGL